MAPSVDSNATLAVPGIAAGPPPAKSIRRQPSASRITVSTKPQHPQPADDDAIVVGSSTATASPPSPASPTAAEVSPKKPRQRKLARRRRGPAAATESESGSGSESDTGGSDAGAAASSSSLSQASGSDSDADDSDDDTDDEQDEEDIDDDEGAGGAGLLDGAAAGLSKDEPEVESAKAAALDYKQWSTLAEEELPTVLASAQPGPASSTSSDHLGDRQAAGASNARGGRGGRGGLRGRGRGAAYGAHVASAVAYREKLEKDPSFTPRVGQFWGHDERLFDQDLRGLSGWWRGRGGAAAANPATRGRGKFRGGRGGAAFPGAGGHAHGHELAVRGGGGTGARGRGRGAPRGGAAASVTGPRHGMTAAHPGPASPPPRKSKLAGWDDDESEVDDDALHGKSVRRVPAAAQPIYAHMGPRHPAAAAAQAAVDAKHDFDGVPTGPRADLEVADAIPHREWDADNLASDGKIGAWKASLDETQMSPSEAPQKPDSAVELSSSTSNGADGISASERDNQLSAGKPVSTAAGPEHLETPKPAASVPPQLPSSGFGRNPGAAGVGQWTHDGFEALQQAEARPVGLSARGTAAAGAGAVRGGSMRGAGISRGFGRGRGGVAAHGFRGRGGFAQPAFVYGRGAHGFVRGGARGGAGFVGAGMTRSTPNSGAGPHPGEAPTNVGSNRADAAQNERDSERLTALVKGLAMTEHKNPAHREPTAQAPVPVKVNLPRTRSQEGEPPTQDAAQATASPSQQAGGTVDETLHRTTASITTASAAVPAFRPGSALQANASGARAGKVGSVSTLPVNAAKAPAFRPGSAASGRVSTPADDRIVPSPELYLHGDSYRGGAEYTPPLSADMGGYGLAPAGYESGGAVYYNDHHGHGGAGGFRYGGPPPPPLPSGYPMDQPMYSPRYGAVSGGEMDGYGYPSESAHLGHHGGVRGTGAHSPAGGYYQPVMMHPTGSGDGVGTPTYDYVATPPFMTYALPPADHYPGYYTPPPPPHGPHVASTLPPPPPDAAYAFQPAQAFYHHEPHLAPHQGVEPGLASYAMQSSGSGSGEFDPYAHQPTHVGAQ
ncbi:uncharacterized protein PFL1_04416 [Pseudozyma flocculosa PF-1]|uniref:Btz domain-containing protein n=2 Tax=Pseudozyma flocculosa TaxID=84751 RepID=A0A5C3FCL0_9BASI|nr:uncharacterized protein PFL1_04416 [Pseudozyma flocculosa PF-1]EPQ28089.1 hypothetical protein PFL1_04416 [Pseudozyma flocculosa PF-1]SPO41886.1 uncharacterized protein PSFLO_07368 [Pseudozyma flocculosa]